MTTKVKQKLQKRMLSEAMDKEGIEDSAKALNKISPESAKELLEVTGSYGTLGFQNLRQKFQNWIIETMTSKDEFEANLKASIKGSGEWNFDWDSNSINIQVPDNRDLFVETCKYLDWMEEGDTYLHYEDVREEALLNCDEHAFQFITNNLNEVEVGDE